MLVKLVNNIKSWKEKHIREGAITEATAIGGLIWGSGAAYVGFNEAFVEYEGWNTACKIAGTAGIAFGAKYFLSAFYDGVIRPMRETNEYLEKQNKNRDRE